MGSWQDRLKAYRNAGGTVEQLADDNTARKIIKGLGWSEKHIDALCTCLGLEPAEDASHLDKALDILDRVSGGLFSETSPNRKFIVSRRKVAFSNSFWNGETAKQLLDMAKGMEGGMVIFHMKASDEAQHRNLAIVILHEGQTCMDGVTVPGWMLKSPATFKMNRNGMDIWVKETEDLIHDMAETWDWYIPSARDIIE